MIGFQRCVAQVSNNEGVDVVLRPVKQIEQDQKNVILCEYQIENRRSRESAWAAALNQCVEYCKRARYCEEAEIDTVYLTVNMGTNMRFYELRPDADQTIDRAPAGGRTYELTDDDEEVWRLWIQMRDLILQQRVG